MIDLLNSIFLSPNRILFDWISNIHLNKFFRDGVGPRDRYYMCKPVLLVSISNHR